MLKIQENCKKEKQQQCFATAIDLSFSEVEALQKGAGGKDTMCGLCMNGMKCLWEETQEMIFKTIDRVSNQNNGSQ